MVKVLGKYCVRIGERSSKRWFPHFTLCLYAYRAVMAVGVGILYGFPILYFVLLAINVYVVVITPFGVLLLVYKAKRARPCKPQQHD